MRWKDRQGSNNVEDRRASTGGGGGGRAGLGGSGASLLMMILSRFGIKGVLIAAVGVIILWRLGIVDPSQLLSDGAGNGSGYGSSAASVEISPEEQELYEFVRVVLAGTEEVWSSEFSRLGADYQEPTLVVYRGAIRTACGTGQSAMGPFYCPGDRKVYIDLSFYDELEQSFQAPGDFAQAYVVAHEVGHHVQKLLGTSDKVSAMRGRPNYNEYSVRLELQADFYAGVWAHHSRQYLERGDIEEAMRAANAIGDDAIQKKSQGHVVPHAFTHGTSEQRMRWFNKGLQSGRMEDGDTFSQPYETL
ncbi:MAG: neutral zinc metallopeptidase [Verrucomicrobiae bacterium]|nr:neutral zinc metallopeptidase [Verrucomicrobiae bacterium]